MLMYQKLKNLSMRSVMMKRLPQRKLTLTTTDWQEIEKEGRM